MELEWPAMDDGPRIDAHIHQWDPRVTPRTVTPAVKAPGWNPRLLRTLAEKAVPTALLEFIGDPETALNPYLPGMWRADTRPRRVRGFVHVQADWQAKGAMGVVDETRWLEQVCGSDLLAVVGRVDLASPSLDAILDGHHAASHRFRGIRDYLAHSNGNDALADWASRPDRTAEAAWRRGYVEEYVPIGEDVHPDPPGDGTLQLTLRNVALPFDDLGAAFPTGVIPGPGSAITQVDVVGWFEGQQDFAIGTATEGPFRVYSDHPRRIVVEVAHS